MGETHLAQNRRLWAKLPLRSWAVVLVITVALTVVGSRWTFRFIDYTYNTTRYEVWAEQGRVGLMVGDASMPQGVWGGMWNRKGIRWRPQRAKASMTMGALAVRVDGFIIPVWCFGAAGLIAVTGVWWFRTKRPTLGCCQSCGYSLEGLTMSTCPECGSTIVTNQ